MIGSAAIGWSHGEPAIFATSAISTPIRAPIDEKPLDLDTSLLDDPGRLLSIHAIRVRDGKLLWRSPAVRQSYGAATYANGVVLAPSTFSSTVVALDAENGLPLSIQPVVGPPSSAPVTVGSMMFIGGGTRTTDLEYKAFGAGALDAFGPSPLTPVSGIWGYKLLFR
jgi:outer membrane protein assembly factor BamB